MAGGGCWICNPWCGKCQPPPFRPGNCPDCGTLTVFEKAQVIAGGPLLCKKCGKDLSYMCRPKVVLCNYSGKLCAYSCVKSVSPKHDWGDQPCERNTPPSKEWMDAHPTAVAKARH